MFPELRLTPPPPSPIVVSFPLIICLRRPLPILGMGMVVLGLVLLLLLLVVQNKTKVDPLFYGTPSRTRRSGDWRSFSVCFIVSVVSSVCRVLLHLHGGSDQRPGAGRLHLRLHGLLHKDGNIKLHTTATSRRFMFHTSSLVSSSGRASLEHLPRCDDVILGRRLPLPPLPHHHPPHVPRVSRVVLPVAR